MPPTEAMVYVVDDGSAEHVGNFLDVPKKSWYADSVQWAANQGITEGSSLTTFSPNVPCTTSQILTFLWRATGTEEASVSNPFPNITEGDWYYKPVLWAYENNLINGSYFNGDLPCTRVATVAYLWKLTGKPIEGKNSFADIPSNAEYAPAIAWAVENGITTGTSDTMFSPNDICTRGQIVTFLYRWHQLGQV